MIVEEPPYDLVVLFADLDAQRLISGLIERGQERNCIRQIRWRPIRDPRRDVIHLVQENRLRPLLERQDRQTRVVLVWDHEGSGREADAPQDVESQTVQQLVTSGFREDHVTAVAIYPELEAVLLPAWDRVKQILSAERGLLAPTDDEVRREAARFTYQGIPDDAATALSVRPKEMFLALVRLVRLRHSAVLYQRLGLQLSIPQLKREGSALLRLLENLAEWYSPNG